MTDPQPLARPGDDASFHVTIHGGQQALGSDQPTFIQHNYGPVRPEQELRELLTEIRQGLAGIADPEPARQQVAVIEQEIAARSRDKTRVLAAIQALTAYTTAGTALAEAVARAAALVSRYWPGWPQ